MEAPEGVAAGQELSRKLRTGALVARGRRGNPTASAALIHPSELEGVRIDPIQRSAVSEATGETVLSDLRIFPILEAPNAVDYLHGKTILEAIELLVFGDPQVVALRARAEKLGGSPRDIRLLRYSRTTFWRVTCRPQPPWDSPLDYLNRDDPKRIAVLAADFVLERRFERLMEYLRSGDVTVEAIDRAGARARVSRSMWSRESTFIDLMNQDLVEYVPETFPPEYSSPLYRALELRVAATTASFHVKGTEHAQGASVATNSVRKRQKAPATPRRNDLLRALPKAELDLRTTDLTPSQIIAKVARFLDKPPKTPADHDALRKLILRVRKDLRADR